MSEKFSSASRSIFDDEDINDLKEKQLLVELELKAQIQKTKLDQKHNKQKILMGSFLGVVLSTEGAEEDRIREYFAQHLPEFLTREDDRELFKGMVERLGGRMEIGEADKQVIAIISTIKRGETSSIYNELLKLAKSKGLTLRPSSEPGDTPMKFELVYRSSPKGDNHIIGDLSADEVAACRILKNGYSLRETIEQYVKLS